MNGNSKNSGSGGHYSQNQNQGHEKKNQNSQKSSLDNQNSSQNNQKSSENNQKSRLDNQNSSQSNQNPHQKNQNNQNSSKNNQNSSQNNQNSRQTNQNPHQKNQNKQNSSQNNQNSGQNNQNSYQNNQNPRQKNLNPRQNNQNLNPLQNNQNLNPRQNNQNLNPLQNNQNLNPRQNNQNPHQNNQNPRQNNPHSQQNYQRNLHPSDQNSRPNNQNHPHQNSQNPRQNNLNQTRHPQNKLTNYRSNQNNYQNNQNHYYKDGRGRGRGRGGRWGWGGGRGAQAGGGDSSEVRGGNYDYKSYYSNHNYCNRNREFHSTNFNSNTTIINSNSSNYSLNFSYSYSLTNLTTRYSPVLTPATSASRLELAVIPHQSVYNEPWKSLAMRYKAIQKEIKTVRKNFEEKRYDAEEEVQRHFQELLKSNSAILKEKVEERDAMRALEMEVKAEREALTEDSSSSDVEKVAQREEKVKIMKEAILDSLSEIHDSFSIREEEFRQQFLEESTRLEEMRRDMLENLRQQESTLDFQIHKFFNDKDIQWLDLELERRLNLAHPTLQQQLIKTKEKIQLLTECLEDLEGRHCTQVEQMQQITSDYAFEINRIVDEYESSKYLLINKAKYEGVIEFLQGKYTLPDSDISLYSLPNKNGDNPEYVAQLQASLCSENKIPPSSGLKLENGQPLTDLRDRHEDLKSLGWSGSDSDKTSTLDMIKKIVSQYESQDMRVYEHIIPNQYVSRLVWCPDNLMYPDVEQGIFSTGYGNTKEEATEKAVIWAYSHLQEKNSDAYTDSDSVDCEPESHSSFDPVSHLPRMSYEKRMTQFCNIDDSIQIVSSSSSDSEIKAEDVQNTFKQGELPDPTEPNGIPPLASECSSGPVLSIHTDPQSKPSIYLESSFKPPIPSESGPVSFEHSPIQLIPTEPVSIPFIPVELKSRQVISSEPLLTTPIPLKLESYETNVI